METVEKFQGRYFYRVSVRKLPVFDPHLDLGLLWRSPVQKVKKERPRNFNTNFYY